MDVQTYKEIVEDNHPIIIISAIDSVEILKKSGIKTVMDVEKWLKSNFWNEFDVLIVDWCS